MGDANSMRHKPAYRHMSESLCDGIAVECSCGWGEDDFDHLFQAEVAWEQHIAAVGVDTHAGHKCCPSGITHEHYYPPSMCGPCNSLAETERETGRILCAPGEANIGGQLVRFEQPEGAKGVRPWRRPKDGEVFVWADPKDLPDSFEPLYRAVPIEREEPTDV